jgi:PAS domain S-box-containing protein
LPILSREVPTHPKDSVIDPPPGPARDGHLEDPIRTTASRFQILTEQAPVGIFLTDANGDCKFVNRRWEEITGLTAEEARGSGWARAIHPDDSERLFAEWYTAANEGREFASEYRFQTPDGKVRWVQGRAVPLRDEHGQVTEYLGSVTDITDRRLAEIALRESEERFRRVQEASPEGFILLRVERGLHGRVENFLFLQANSPAVRILGQDLCGRRMVELFPSVRESRFWAACMGVADGGPSEILEHPYKADGLDAWYRNLIVRVGDDELAVTFSDVTARRKSAEQTELLARASEVFSAAQMDLPSLLETIADHVKTGIGDTCVIMLTSTDGPFLAPAALLSRNPELVAVGNETLRDAPIRIGQTVLGKVAQTGEPLRMPIVVPEVLLQGLEPAHRAYMDRFPVHSLMVVPIRARGAVLGVVAVSRLTPDRPYTERDQALLQDLADRAGLAIGQARAYDAERTARERAEAAARQADEASRLKEEFLATVSHELRTPLSAILGWATILKSERQTDPTMLCKGLEVIERNARSQLRIIEDILDVSRIIRGELRIETEPVDLERIGTEVLESVRPSAEAKEIELIHVGCDEPCRIAGDSERLRQILWNLLSNAVKFTKRGGKVWLTIAPEGGKMVLSVRDTGRGIDPAFVPHVFERFRQADGSTTRSSGGLGLGLAIVRHLTEMHGGTVTAESEGLDLGATFTVTLPVKAFSAPVRSASREAPDSNQSPPLSSPWRGALAGTRVLIVEDEDDARELIETLLSGAGAVVKAASSAEEAVEQLADFDPKVLVSDIGMPGHDGYWLVDAVRKLRPRLPVIALTAFSRAEDARRARAAGFDHHLGKPIDPEQLVEMVALYR